MLNIDRFYIRAALVVLLVAYACGNKPPNGDITLQKIEPPFPQTLSVKNETQNPITIIPLAGSQDQPIPIAPDDSEQLQFTVVRMAQLDRSGNPVATTWTAIINGVNQYIGMQNTDGLLQIQTPGGETWDYLISLGECWFDNNPPAGVHEIVVIDEEPALGIPALRLCE